MNRTWAKVLMIGLCLTLTAGSASAGNKSNKFKDKDVKYAKSQAQTRDGIRVGGVVIPTVRDDRSRVRRNGHRPPGWNRGRKTGWGNCNLPPGQAKKRGCRQYVRRPRRETRPVIVLPEVRSRR